MTCWLPPSSLRRRAALAPDYGVVPAADFGRTDSGDGDTKHLLALARAASRHSSYRHQSSASLPGGRLLPPPPASPTASADGAAGSVGLSGEDSTVDCGRATGGHATTDSSGGGGRSLRRGRRRRTHRQSAGGALSAAEESAEGLPMWVYMQTSRKEHRTGRIRSAGCGAAALFSRCCVGLASTRAKLLTTAIPVQASGAWEQPRTSA